MPGWKEARSLLLVIQKSVAKGLEKKKGKGQFFKQGQLRGVGHEQLYSQPLEDGKQGVSPTRPLPREKYILPSFLHEPETSRNTASGTPARAGCASPPRLRFHMVGGQQGATPQPRDAHLLHKAKKRGRKKMSKETEAGKPRIAINPSVQSFKKELQEHKYSCFTAVQLP